MHMPLRSSAPSAYSRRPSPPLPWITWKFSLIFVVAIVAILVTVIYNAVAGSSDPAIQFRVVDASGAPVSGATITLENAQATTDNNGLAKLSVSDGEHQLSVESPGFVSASGTIDRSDGTKREITLQAEQPEPPAATDANPAAVVAEPTAPDATAEVTATPPATSAGAAISGKILDPSGEPIQGARVVSGNVWDITGKDGIYELARDQIDASKPLTFVAPGYKDQQQPVPSGSEPLEIKLDYFSVKGIYFSTALSNTPEDIDRLINLINTTELNAIVIDVKEELVFYDSQVSFFRDAGTVQPSLDLPNFLQTLRDNNIYTIARQVVFKDSLVAEARPDLAVKNEQTGEPWRDMNDVSWVNPTNEILWQANVDMAVELAQLGFDEIQYDYVRFPTDGDLSTMDFGVEYNQANREAAIEGFLKLSHEALIPTGAKLSADVFGYTMLVDDDLGIGQNFASLVDYVDYLSPMVYPSHYGDSAIGYAPPNDYPYELISDSMVRARGMLGGNARPIRPWLQDFDFPGMTPYGPKEVRAQIDAVEENGGSGWLLWDPNNVYTAEALNPESGNASQDGENAALAAIREERAAGRVSSRRRAVLV
ncbi:MAG TPA: putative glycoside hydrolase [Thermomicrobiales bacterium]|nr:putative glycoside hydrolase [Thermomicrobiales bacterium]